MFFFVAFQDSSDRLQSGSLTQGVINDIFFWCLKEFTTLAADMKLCLVDCLTDSAKYVCDQLNEGLTTNQKNNAKKLLFYFVQLCLKAEADATSSTTTSMTDKTKGKGTKTKRSQSNSGYDWKIQRLDCLLVLEDIVSAKLGQLWSMGIVEEAFTNPIWKYCVELLESKAAGISGSSHIEGQGRQRCVEVIAQSTSHFGSTLTSGSYCALATALMDTMIHHEHMIVYVADICRIEHHSYKTQHLSTEIMTEISKMNFSALSSTSIKNVSSFVEAFARLDTMSFIPFIAILVKQVDSPAYPMRSAMLQALGHVIQWIHDVLTGKTSFSDGQTSAEDAADGGRHSELLIRQRDSLLNMMIERTHDVNPYTRSCLLKVWMQLIESQSLPIKRIGSIAEVAVDRLLDRNYLVRRAAIALLTSIIDSNPFASQLEHDIFANQKEEVLKLMEQRYDELSENTGRKALEDVDVDSTLVTAANKKKHDEGMPSKGRRNMSALPTPEQALLAATGEDDEEDEDELDEEELIADAKQDDVMQELRQRLDYLQSALELISAIHIAIPRIASMLESKTTSDVTESVHFFNRAVNFQLHGTLDHFKK